MPAIYFVLQSPLVAGKKRKAADQLRDEVLPVYMTDEVKRYVMKKGGSKFVSELLERAYKTDAQTNLQIGKSVVESEATKPID